MGNLCSAESQATVNVGKTCYKVNGSEACEVGQNEISKAQGITSFVSCLLSAILVFFIMDRKKMFSKIVLGLTLISAIAGLVSFFIYRQKTNDIVSGKPKC